MRSSTVSHLRTQAQLMGIEVLVDPSAEELALRVARAEGLLMSEEPSA